MNTTQIAQNDTDLSWAVGHLADARQRYEQAKAALDAKRAAWEAEHQAEFDDLAALKTQMERYDQVVRDQALEAFRATAEKKPHPAVEIKIVESPLFDTPLAEDWARRNMPGLFVFNSKAYGQILRAWHESKTLAGVLPPMPGRMEAEPKAYISSNLSNYLPVMSDEQPLPSTPFDTQELEPVQS
jgi:hypothetical protein